MDFRGGKLISPDPSDVAASRLRFDRTLACATVESLQGFARARGNTLFARPNARTSGATLSRKYEADESSLWYLEWRIVNFFNSKCLVQRC